MPSKHRRCGVRHEHNDHLSPHGGKGTDTDQGDRQRQIGADGHGHGHGTRTRDTDMAKGSRVTDGPGHGHGHGQRATGHGSRVTGHGVTRVTEHRHARAEMPFAFGREQSCNERLVCSARRVAGARAQTWTSRLDEEASRAAASACGLNSSWHEACKHAEPATPQNEGCLARSTRQARH